MDGNQNNNQFPNTSPIQNSNPPEIGNQKSIKVFVILVAIILVLGFVFALLFTLTQKSEPASLGVDKDGVPIIILDKKQVIEKVTTGKPLDEPEVRAVFRWATENPEKAARLSSEEKANIIRALNE